MKTKEWFRFNVGRGGQFNNAGHLTLVEKIENIDSWDVVNTCELLLLERDDKGRFCNVLRDGEREIITLTDLKKAIKEGRVVIDIDGPYESYIFTLYENALEREKELIDIFNNK